MEDFDVRQPVRWPDGYTLEQAREVRLLDEEGNLIASEGDTIYVGGGFTRNDELFIACPTGDVSRDPP